MQQNKRGVFFRLLGYVRPYAGYVVLALLLVLMVTSSDLLRPLSLETPWT